MFTRERLLNPLHQPAELSRPSVVQIRRVDMRASPYDVSAYGLESITVETHDSKREYAELQGDFATRGGDLRARIVASIEALRP